MKPSLAFLRFFVLLCGRGRMPSAKQAKGQRKKSDQRDGLRNGLTQLVGKKLRGINILSFRNSLIFSRLKSSCRSNAPL